MNFRIISDLTRFQAWLKRSPPGHWYFRDAEVWSNGWETGWWKPEWGTNIWGRSIWAYGPNERERPPIKTPRKRK